jgi:hypothetical protein
MMTGPEGVDGERSNDFVPDYAGHVRRNRGSGENDWKKARWRATIPPAYIMLNKNQELVYCWKPSIDSEWKCQVHRDKNGVWQGRDPKDKKRTIDKLEGIFQKLKADYKPQIRYYNGKGDNKGNHRKEETLSSIVGIPFGNPAYYAYLRSFADKIVDNMQTTDTLCRGFSIDYNPDTSKYSCIHYKTQSWRPPPPPANNEDKEKWKQFLNSDATLGSETAFMGQNISPGQGFSKR